jgi:hypothetical protein
MTDPIALLIGVMTLIATTMIVITGDFDLADD